MTYRRFPRHLAGLPTAAAALAVALAAGALPASAAPPLRLQGEAAAFVNSTFFWNFSTPPPGANVPCTPSASHPYPVILTEATFGSMYNNFGAISPDLVNNGYCVYAFNYGQTLPLTSFNAMGDIRASAARLSAEVKRVLAETGASKVDIVGWSQGGMMPRYYIDSLGGARNVNMLVGLAPSNYGTNLDGLTSLLADLGLLGLDTALLSVACDACVQQISGSAFLTGLNRAPTVPGVKYVVIETEHDRVVSPYTNAFLPAGPNVQNITLQHQCKADRSDHLSIAYDSNALQDIINVLGPDSPGFQPACARVGPLFGNV
jgi:triacylglycerol esterase/lipase EstA (alpha/beta hydrolase family)